MARLSMPAALLLALAVYGGIGLVLPLANNAGTAALIAWNVFGVLLGLVLILARLYPFIESRVRHHLLEWTTNLRLLSAEEFEWLVGELLRREGWGVEETGRHGTPDGGVDLRIHRGNEHRLVQCKRWDSRTVGVEEVRKLAGTVSRENLPREAAMLVTLSSFTEAARNEAAGVTLVDGTQLLRRLELVRTPEPCPECGTPMRFGRSPRGWWYHCPRWPSCKGKRDLSDIPSRAVEVLAAAGH